MDTQLKILVIDANLERAEVLLSGLDDVGYALVEHLQDMTNLVQRIAVIDPDVILLLQLSIRYLLHVLLLGEWLVDEDMPCLLVHK